MHTTRLIKDEWIEEDLNYLATSSEISAAARAEKVRAEFNRKQIKAKLVLRSPESSVAMRDAWAEAHQDYAIACEEEVKAIENDEFHRCQRNKSDAIIEAYRTEQASLRAGASFK